MTRTLPAQVLAALTTLAALGLAAATPQPARAQAYTYTTLDDPNAATDPSVVESGTFALGLNDAGQVAGLYTSADSIDHGFVYQNGQFTPVDDPSAGTAVGDGTSALGINDGGQVAGVSLYAPGRSHGFTADAGGGTFADFDVPGADNTYAHGISNNGLISGLYSTPAAPAGTGDSLHGFLDDQGQFTTLDAPGAGTAVGEGTDPFGVNDAGEVVGTVSDGNNLHGFTYQNGQFTPFDDPLSGTTTTYARFGGAAGINDLGEIVGFYTDNSNTTHGYLYDNGQFTTIDAPPGASGGIFGTQLTGINDKGQIVGFYGDSANAFHGFLMTPTPEPSAFAGFALGALGLGVLGLSTRRRRVGTL